MLEPNNETTPIYLNNFLYIMVYDDISSPPLAVLAAAVASMQVETSLTGCLAPCRNRINDARRHGHGTAPRAQTSTGYQPQLTALNPLLPRRSPHPPAHFSHRANANTTAQQQAS